MFSIFGFDSCIYCVITTPHKIRYRTFPLPLNSLSSNLGGTFLNVHHSINTLLRERDKMCCIDWSALAVVILICRIDDYLIKKYDFLSLSSSTQIIVRYHLRIQRIHPSIVLKCLSYFQLPG